MFTWRTGLAGFCRELTTKLKRNGLNGNILITTSKTRKKCSHERSYFLKKFIYKKHWISKRSNPSNHVICYEYWIQHCAISLDPGKLLHSHSMAHNTHLGTALEIKIMICATELWISINREHENDEQTPVEFIRTRLFIVSLQTSRNAYFSTSPTDVPLVPRLVKGRTNFNFFESNFGST